MNYTGNLIFMMVLSLLVGGCNSVVDHGGRHPLVQVDKDFLYQEDLRLVMPVGLHGEDSIRFTQKYIRNWVEDALLFRKAEGNVPDNAKIEELVNAYRRTLITHLFQDELVRQQVGEEITEVDIEDYYNKNSHLFRAQQPYVQGLFLKIPLTASRLPQVCIWYKKNTQDALDKLEKFCIGNAVSYDYFYDRWQPATDILSRFPLKELDVNSDYLDHNRNIEVRDTAFCYLLHVEKYLSKGELLPLEFARNEIKEILINLKRVDFINRMKNDLYDDASENKDIIYY